jgi:hypothetical protein
MPPGMTRLFTSSFFKSEHTGTYASTGEFTATIFEVQVFSLPIERILMITGEEAESRELRLSRGGDRFHLS